MALARRLTTALSLPLLFCLSYAHVEQCISPNSVEVSLLLTLCTRMRLSADRSCLNSNVTIDLVLIFKYLQIPALR